MDIMPLEAKKVLFFNPSALAFVHQYIKFKTFLSWVVFGILTPEPMND